jgi:hypothetical protein
MSVAQYVDRTIDLLAYQDAPAVGEVLTTQELVQSSNNGQICTGIQKLAQRFLLELLTEAGSIAYLPNRGCLFMTDARLGMFGNSFDVMASFSSALVDIKRNLQDEETSYDPLDERFEEAEVVNVTFAPGNASITVRITSSAGTDREVIAPLNVVL